MSCFLVSKEHIDFITGALVSLEKDINLSNGESYQWSKIDDLTKVGNILWSDNVISCTNRYDKNTISVNYVYNGYVTSRVNDKYITTLLKALDCLEYQSCEHQEWETSKALEIIKSIRECAISNLSMYESVPWVINRSDNYLENFKRANVCKDDLLSMASTGDVHLIDNYFQNGEKLSLEELNQYYEKTGYVPKDVQKLSLLEVGKNAIEYFRDQYSQVSDYSYEEIENIGFKYLNSDFVVNSGHFYVENGDEAPFFVGDNFLKNTNNNNMGMDF